MQKKSKLLCALFRECLIINETSFRAIGERLLSRYRNDKVALKELHSRIKEKEEQHKQQRAEVLKQIEEHHAVSLYHVYK